MSDPPHAPDPLVAKVAMPGHGPTGLPASAHSMNKFLPKAQRHGVALCLSGGGFRAALFHLGALRRLNELGILSQVSTLSCVSGGSILAAHLATHLREWPAPGRAVPGDRWEAEIAEPFRNFTRRDLRSDPIRRRLLPWNWLNERVASEALADRYAETLTPLTLADLPARPHYIFCATNMQFGSVWTFERGAIGDDEAGYRYAVTQAAMHGLRPDPTVDTFPLARAVAASSCFPPIYNPIGFDLSDDQIDRLREFKQQQVRAQPDLAWDTRNWRACLKRLRLSDGGLYDNLGLEPVWKDHRVVLVSDGGAPFDFATDPHRNGSIMGVIHNMLWRVGRYTSILQYQIGEVRKRWLMSNFLHDILDGLYWGVNSATEHYARPGGYSKRLVHDLIGNVRTDMDRFTDAEIGVLENHGYLLANAAVDRWAASNDLAYTPHPLTVPHPDMMDERRVRQALRNSHKRIWFGTRR